MRLSFDLVYALPAGSTDSFSRRREIAELYPFSDEMLTPVPVEGRQWKKYRRGKELIGDLRSRRLGSHRPGRWRLG